MVENESLGSFFKTNKKLATEYIETRLELVKLSTIRMASRSMGYLIWLIISLFLAFMLVLFVGLTLGFWLSRLLDSYVGGFGLVTLGLGLLCVILTVFRKKLFLEPIMQLFLDRANDEIEEIEENE
jgi:hypothetical protein